MPSVKTLRHQEVLFARLFEEITQIRIDEPERPLAIAKKRKCRQKLTGNGRLNILAADYPARRIVKAANQPLAMANRQDFLTRIVRILSAEAADGVVATMDVIEDLLIMHELMANKGLPAFLDDKLLIASLNRGGINGTIWELDDAISGPSPAQSRQWNIDAVKILLRVCDDDANSSKTLQYTRNAITEANSVQMPVFLELLPMVRNDARLAAHNNAEALARLIGVATALGDSSRYLWLMLTACQEFDLVARATSLPVLLLGSDTDGLAQLLQEIKTGMSAAHNVRGTMLGRNVLYPPDQDPVEAATLVHELVHKLPARA